MDRHQNFVIIVEDSMIKGVQPVLLRSSTHKSVLIRTFPVATTEDMLDCPNPSVRKPPSHLTVHVSANDLKSHDATSIVKNIPTLGNNIRKESLTIKIIISHFITRKDTSKSMKLNSYSWSGESKKATRFSVVRILPKKAKTGMDFILTELAIVFWLVI